MITIASGTAQNPAPDGLYQPGGVENGILQQMEQSAERFAYSDAQALQFEIALRAATVGHAVALNRSGMDFSVFRKTRCNPAYWERTPDGGFVLRASVSAAAAIRDIYQNGRQYATECATAMLIVFYGAVLSLYPDALFDRLFGSIRLMNWRYVPPVFAGVARMSPARTFLPGDRQYFMNPDVNPLTPEWQGENVILLDGGHYYGHGIGIGGAAEIIRALNENRTQDAMQSAFLMDQAGRPDYHSLDHALRGGAR